MEKISIIVPVYNVEKYIGQCVNSLIHQTFRNIEIILIDDGSTDKSLKICEEFAKKDARVIIKRNEKKGVSEARNLGIDLSTGEWIMFVDSDDWVEDNMTEKVYEIARYSNADIVMCDAYINMRNKQIKNNFFNTDRKIFKDKQKVLLQIQAIEDIKGEYKPKMACGVPWAKLYRRSFLKERNLKFDKKLPRMQDMIFNLYAFEEANYIEYVSIPLYHYRKSNFSVCNIYDEKMLQKHEAMLQALRKFIEFKKEDKEKIVEVYNIKVLHTLSGYIDQLLRKEKPKYKIKELKSLINDYLNAYYQPINDIKNENIDLLKRVKKYCVIKRKIISLIILMIFIEFIHEIKRNKNYN